MRDFRGEIEVCHRDRASLGLPGYWPDFGGARRVPYRIEIHAPIEIHAQGIPFRPE